MIDKDLAIDLLQSEVYRLREENRLLIAEKVASFNEQENTFEKALVDKTFPPKCLIKE